MSAVELGSEIGLGPGELLSNVNVPETLLEVAGLPLPPIISVAGWKNAGKTTVAAGLIAELVDRGIDVAALKHGHGFRVDSSGTDSWRLRHEGRARRVLMSGPDGMALIGGWSRGERSLGSLVREHLRDADLIVAEGWRHGPWPTIEVRRGDGDPLHVAGAPDEHRFLAVVGAPAGDGGPKPLHVDFRDPRRSGLLADLVEARLL
jgi:molybdopterin-guanine dinucleotide biosynthesis protein B